MRDYIFQACEEIDAAVFSGDDFIGNPQAVNELSIYMARWRKELASEILINNITMYQETWLNIIYIEQKRKQRADF